ncbi:Glutamyl-tRNA(Gln) amidotransferase subunit A [Bienertia sinuspersici]
MTTIKSTSPLYIHPSDGTNSMTRKRSLEIVLASKRKLGFVSGGVTRNNANKVKQEAWDTCNNMLISRIHNNVSDSIKKSILFMNNAKQI